MTGKFHIKMTIERLANTDAGFGDGPSEEWEALRDEMFMLKPVRGDEPVVGQQVQSHTLHEARCHFFQQPDTKMRLKYQNRIFHVESVTNWMERNRFLDWRLTEVVDG